MVAVQENVTVEIGLVKSNKRRYVIRLAVGMAVPSVRLSICLSVCLAVMMMIELLCNMFTPENTTKVSTAILFRFH